MDRFKILLLVFLLTSCASAPSSDERRISEKTSPYTQVADLTGNASDALQSICKGQAKTIVPQTRIKTHEIALLGDYQCRIECIASFSPKKFSAIEMAITPKDKDHEEGMEKYRFELVKKKFNDSCLAEDEYREKFGHGAPFFYYDENELCVTAQKITNFTTDYGLIQTKEAEEIERVLRDDVSFVRKEGKEITRVHVVERATGEQIALYQHASYDIGQTETGKQELKCHPNQRQFSFLNHVFDFSGSKTPEETQSSFPPLKVAP